MFAKHFELMSPKDSGALTHCLAHSACTYFQMSIFLCMLSHSSHQTSSLVSSFLNISLCYMNKEAQTGGLVNLPQMPAGGSIREFVL